MSSRQISFSLTKFDNSFSSTLLRGHSRMLRSSAAPHASAQHYLSFLVPGKKVKCTSKASQRSYVGACGSSEEEHAVPRNRMLQTLTQHLLLPHAPPRCCCRSTFTDFTGTKVQTLTQHLLLPHAPPHCCCCSTFTDFTGKTVQTLTQHLLLPHAPRCCCRCCCTLLLPLLLLLLLCQHCCCCCC